jgi:hypothetical protein
VSVSVEKQAILLSLEPLFREAEEKELWFFHESNESGEIWCSPEYLRLKQSQGEFVWAPEHWELRSPLGYLRTLRTQAEGIVKEFNTLASRLGQNKGLKLSEVAGSPKGETNG